MIKTPPSIFNDVIGPVMRGPSSSHTAASVRIGAMIRQMLGEQPAKAIFEFDPNGSLATTYETQGSAMGLAAGLMTWEITHPDLSKALQKARESGIEIDFKICPIAVSHPNTYKIFIEGVSGKQISATAVSVGGGMIEFTEVEGFQVSMKGDFFESLFVINECEAEKIKELKSEIVNKFSDAIVHIEVANENTLLNIKSRKSQFQQIQELFPNHFKIKWSTEVHPVLPILSSGNYHLPFTSYLGMIDYVRGQEVPLSLISLDYESARAGISKEKVFQKMKELVDITKSSIEEGLSGTDYEDRILGRQSQLILEAEKQGSLIPSKVNRIIAYTSAIMEVKSSMGVIIASPTAGSCAVLGGALFGIFGLDADLDKMTQAFLAAGLIGIFIANEYTFAAEEGGCQVECGAASGMAAAALVELMGGDCLKAVSAASMAMQNLIGLICDPVANRVEVPCLGKNILGATNALTAANMSLAGFDEVIPLNEVIEAMKNVGEAMPPSMCCTGHAGLSVTKCSKKIDQQINKN